MNTAQDLSEDFLKKEQLEQARLTAPLSHETNNLPDEENADSYDKQNDEDGQDNVSKRLARARERDNKHQTLANKASHVAENATPKGVVSLVNQINPLGDMPFVAALGAALLKDLTDLADAETVILPMIFSAFCSIIIFMMLLLVHANGKRKWAKKNKGIVKRFGQQMLIILGGGIADSIPGLDIFPIETFSIILIYIMTLIERKESATSEPAVAADEYEEDGNE